MTTIVVIFHSFALAAVVVSSATLCPGSADFEVIASSARRETIAAAAPLSADNMNINTLTQALAQNQAPFPEKIRNILTARFAGRKNEE